MTLQDYNRLGELKEAFPELTFNNDGYQYLGSAVKEKHAEQIKEITDIMKKQFPNFVRFDNFKPREDGGFAVRCQTQWSPAFTGVEYFEYEYLKTLIDE